MKIKKTLVLSFISVLLLAFPVTAFAATSTNTVASTSTSTSSSTAPSSSADTIAPKLVRDKAFVDYGNSYLLVGKEFPAKVEAVITGWLPDPCHILQVSVNSATSYNTVNIEVYSLYDPSQVCISVLQPFKTTVELGSFGKGDYTVLVNGIKLGSFSIGSPTFSGTAPAQSSSTTTAKSASIYTLINVLR